MPCQEEDYEVGGDAMPGRGRVFCDGLERDSGRGELRGVELCSRQLVSAGELGRH